MDATTEQYPTTQEGYENAIRILAEFLTDLRAERRWCGEAHRYFQAIMPEYDYNDPTVPDFNKTPDLDDYDKIPAEVWKAETFYPYLLAEIRARVLWYVRHGSTDLDTANDAFRRMGIPTYNDKVPQPLRFTVYAESTTFHVSAMIPGDVPPGDTVENFTKSYVRGNFWAFLTGTLPTGDNHFIPGSLVMEESHSPSVYLESGNMSVQESDTQRPEYV